MVGNEWIGPPKKYVGKKRCFSENLLKKEAVYQLKDISDCIQIDPPGSEQNLEKTNLGKRNPTFWAFFKFLL